MSGLTWGTFYNTDYGCLDDAAEVWAHYMDSAAEIEAKLIEDIPVLKPGAADQERDDFDGETADQVRAQARRICDLFLDDVDAYAGRIKALLQAAREDFEAKRGELADLFAEKNVYLTAKGGPGEEHFEVDESSLYNYLSGTGSFQPMNEYEANDYEQRVREQAVDMSDRFKELMDTVRELDDKYASDFKALNDDPPALPPYVGSADFIAKTTAFDIAVLEQMTTSEPPADPNDVNSWWNSLTEDSQQLLIEERPDLVGPTEGIPVVDRDPANRLLLDDQIANLEAQIAELDANPDPNSSRYNTDALLREELTSQLNNLQDLREQIDGSVKIEDGPELQYYLLDFESTPDGQAVVSVGNPDTAHNVNVYVPGTGAGLDNLNGDLSRAETMTRDAYEYAPAGTENASILWLDYDAPDDLAQATDTMWADNAASDLSSFTDGLRASAEGEPSNLTMTGHSYGSTTIGIAARDEGLNVDNMIFVGSPGVGVDSAADLNIDPDHVYASRNEEDIIGIARDVDIASAGEGILYPTVDDEMVHGIDPTSEAFGGQEFSSEATRDGATENHSAYWDDANDIGRKNMALIMTGQEGIT
ncbi:alpha/beta hydrolase [Glycomyces sp. NPDC049804]|uniref:alpha/beta hydrolase n=1 Tax=Glycomyces sp. NPDC049804 TaxID=3154363 RepID=UPI0034369262